MKELFETREVMHNAKHWIVARQVWKVSLEQKASISPEKNGEADLVDGQCVAETR